MKRFLPILVAATLIAAPPPTRLGAQSISSEKRESIRRVEDFAGQIHSIAQTLWNYSETAMLEEQSAAFLASALEEEGFTVERGVAGMPTAFVAT